VYDDEPLPDAEAVLAYLRQEAQAGAEQAKQVRDLTAAHMNGHPPWTRQYVAAVQAHLSYLGLLAGLTGAMPVDDDDEEEG